MPGSIIDVKVEAGNVVKKGTVLAVMSAMKMEACSSFAFFTQELAALKKVLFIGSLICSPPSHCLTSSLQTVVASPMDGTVKKIAVAPGDMLSAGDLIAIVAP